jgi:hypothetical protein
MSTLPRLIWGWSPDGRRCLLAIPPGIPIDPPLGADEVEIQISDHPSWARTVTPKRDEVALGALVRASKAVR